MILVDAWAPFALLDDQDPHQGPRRSHYVALGETGDRLIVHNCHDHLIEQTRLVLVVTEADLQAGDPP